MPRSTSHLGTVDHYVPCLNHEFELFDHYGEFHWSCRYAKGKSLKVDTLVLTMESTFILDVKVGIDEVTELFVK